MVRKKRKTKKKKEKEKEKKENKEQVPVIRWADKFVCFKLFVTVSVKDSITDFSQIYLPEGTFQEIDGSHLSTSEWKSILAPNMFDSGKFKLGKKFC